MIPTTLGPSRIVELLNRLCSHRKVRFVLLAISIPVVKPLGFDILVFTGGRNVKFLKVTVEKKAVTDLYIGVPDDFHRHRLYNMECSQEIARIAKETTTDSDWDETGWEDVLEVLDVRETTAEEASQYRSEVLKLENSTRSKLEDAT